MELKTYFAQDASGNIMPGATVTVYEAGTATLATGLQDESGSPLANPFTADSSAKVAFYAPDGLYDITVVGNGRTVTIRAQFVSVDGASVLRDDLAAPGGSALVGFQQAGVGAASTTVQDKLREQISPKDFGAVGDGAADDTSALIAAEAAAFAAGKSLFIPDGTYLFNGFWSVRVNVYANGAVIKQASATVSVNSTVGVVSIGASGINIRGLIVDGNLKSTGFTSDGKANVDLIECVARNCLNIGFAFYSGANIDLVRCNASNIRYNATGVGGKPADGFYFGACTRSRWIDCWADDFRRIGFVSEGSGGNKSDQIQALRCVASNANNCDDSTTEYNSAFWAENTNSIDWLYCTAFNMAGNAGQTSGRVRGMQAFAAGNNASGKVNAIGCRVYGGAGTMNRGIYVSGAATFADVLIADCYVSKARVGLSTNCGLNSLTIRNLTLDQIVNVSSGEGGIAIDSGGAALLPIFEIDTVTATNCVWEANAGVVNFFNAPVACVYTLRNVKGSVPHVMRNRVARIHVEECDIAAGCPAYSSFNANYQEHVDCIYTSRNSSNNDYIFRSSALPNGSEIVFRNGSITGFGSGWSHEVGGANITTRFYGTKITNFCLAIATTGTFMNRWDACEFYQVPATIGTIRVNYSAPTKHVFIAQNNYFESADAADTPIRKWNTAPTNSILQGNVHKTATVLHDLGAVSSAVNNVSV